MSDIHQGGIICKSIKLCQKKMQSERAECLMELIDDFRECQIFYT
jgi:t-SNARE complex subunit (syntaxin)